MPVVLFIRKTDSILWSRLRFILRHLFKDPACVLHDFFLGLRLSVNVCGRQTLFSLFLIPNALFSSRFLV